MSPQHYRRHWSRKASMCACCCLGSAVFSMLSPASPMSPGWRRLLPPSGSEWVLPGSQAARALPISSSRLLRSARQPLCGAGRWRVVRQPSPLWITRLGRRRNRAQCRSGLASRPPARSRLAYRACSRLSRRAPPGRRACSDSLHDPQPRLSRALSRAALPGVGVAARILLDRRRRVLRHVVVHQSRTVLR